MKISTNIYAVDTNLSAKMGTVTVTGSNREASSNKPAGRFDTFTLVGTREPNEANKLSFEKADLIRNLDNMSEEEKVDVAVCSYLDMQISCKEALESQELRTNIFKMCQEEKAYYNELKSQGGVISEEGGKYAFTGMKVGTVVDISSIEAALYDAQEKIDSLIIPPDGSDSFGSSIDKMFRTEAEAFSAATGISDDALNLNDDSFYKIRAGLTEENYLEKANETMNSIRERSEQLAKVMGDYMEKNPYAKEKMKDINSLLKNDHSAKTFHMIEILEKYQNEIETSPFKLNPFFNLSSHKEREDETIKISQE